MNARNPSAKEKDPLVAGTKTENQGSRIHRACQSVKAGKPDSNGSPVR